MGSESKWNRTAIIAGIASLAIVGCGGDGGASPSGGGGGGDGMGVETPPVIEEKGIARVDIAEVGTSGASMGDPGAPPPPGGLVPAEADPKKQNDLKGFAYDKAGKEINVLAAMQQAADQYNRVRPSSAPAPGLTQWPELTNVNLLVTVGLVKRIPPPPVGKAWGVENGRKIVLVDAP